MPFAIAGYAHHLADFPEMELTLIGKEPARGSIVGDVDIGPAVVVEGGSGR